MKLVIEADKIPKNFTGIIEYSIDDKHYFVNGLLHREDGPAVEYCNGDKEYWINGKLHRIDGPAVECCNGDKEYWINDLHHRIDGPAVEFADGSKQYWINGKRLTKEQFDKRTNSCDGKTVEIDGKKYKLTLVQG